MGRIHKTCVLLGNIFAFVGIFAILTSQAWRWIFIVRGDRYIGSTPFKLFWVGSAILFVGLFIPITLKRIQKH